MLRVGHDYCLVCMRTANSTGCDSLTEHVLILQDIEEIILLIANNFILDEGMFDPNY